MVWTAAALRLRLLAAFVLRGGGELTDFVANPFLKKSAAGAGGGGLDVKTSKDALSKLKPIKK
jgi:hypothetical protein